MISASRCGLLLILFSVLTATPSTVVQAQDEPGPAELNLPGELGAFGGLSAAKNPVQFSASFRLQEGTREGQLQLKAEILPQWHLYSTTQPEGGPLRSEIRVVPSDQFEVTGSFQPDRDPRQVRSDIFPVPEEQFEQQVVWTAPMRLAAGADPAALQVELVFNGQACVEGVCQPLNDVTVTARFAGEYKKAEPQGEFREPRSHVTIRGHLEPAAVKPGSTVNLVLTAVPDPGWHVYAYASRNPKKISLPTLIAITKSASFPYQAPQASAKPIEKKTEIEAEPVQYYYEEAVTWTIPFQVPSGTKVGTYEIAGQIGYQACTATSCDRGLGAEFSGRARVQQQAEAGPAPLAFASSTYKAVADLAEQQPLSTASAAAATGLEGKPLVFIFGIAFLAGLILNVMPCVLPVIGLKVMSFVQQAGESRVRIFALNAWFALGLMVVFWGLATVSVVLSAFGQQALGWGGQFQLVGFNIALTSLVFVFALSFLGVWEIPIPGFVGTGAATELAEREGAVGAFSKGILATLLATPCSGPMMGPAVGWALAQPAALIYATFTCLGLGMAFPYLLIGVFPQLLRWLPRPGAWMESFKQFMGFVLMGTVVWMISFVTEEYRIPLLTFFVGLGLACWLLGRVSITAELREKLIGWGKAAAVSVAFGYFAFGWLMSSSELPWVPYDRTTLERHLSAGQPVLVDFTADWCATCKVNERFALNVPETKKFVEEHNVAVLKADKTNASPHIDDLLTELGNTSRAIPFLAIYPADGGPPITMDGILTQGRVLEALGKAVSQDSTRTAMK